jgi:hypothetical protein
MMSIAILALGGLALFHFVYESILAPSFRVHLKFRLFSLRDRLRELKCECEPEVSDEVYRYLEGSLNGTIALLQRIDLSAIVRTHELLRRQPRLAQELNERRSAVEACTIKNIKEIRDQSARVARLAFLTNSGAWFLYLVPLFACLFAYQQIKSVIREMLYIRESDLHEIIDFTPAPIG